MTDTTEDRRPARGEGKEALVEAAIAILSEDGLAGVTYRSVAERAGVTHGLVRHHFRTLSELLRRAVAEWAEGSRRSTLLEPGTGDLADLAAELPQDLAVHAAEHVAMYELAMASVRSSELRGEVRETYAEYIVAVTRELERAGFGARSSELGRLVFAAIDGLVLQQLILDEPHRLEEGLALLRGILAGLNDPKS